MPVWILGFWCQYNWIIFDNLLDKSCPSCVPLYLLSISEYIYIYHIALMWLIPWSYLLCLFIYFHLNSMVIWMFLLICTRTIFREMANMWIVLFLIQPSIIYFTLFTFILLWKVHISSLFVSPWLFSGFNIQRLLYCISYAVLHLRPYMCAFVTMWGALLCAPVVMVDFARGSTTD